MPLFLQQPRQSDFWLQIADAVALGGWGTTFSEQGSSSLRCEPVHHLDYCQNNQQ